MAALAPAVAPSLASAYAPSNQWLTQDTTDPTGKVPVTTGPSTAPSDPVSGTAPVPLNTPDGGYSEGLDQAPPDYFAESAFPHAGPWPELPETATGKEPFGTIAPDGITPAGSYKVPPKVTGLTQTKALLPGHDAHSQDTDTAGWDQYTPSGRTAVRQGWEQLYYGVDYYWPTTQPNLARTRNAVGGDQNVGGVVAAYGDLQNSGGNTSYETPAPPTVTAPATGSTGTGTIPTWGF